MHSFSQSLQIEFAKSADAEKSVAMKSYMKNQFEFLGIQTPQRRTLLKEYIRRTEIKDGKELKAIIKELWLLPEREFQYCAMEILMYYKRLWMQAIIELIEYCITNKSWWDTVDFLSYDCAGSYFKMFRGDIKNITGSWNQSENIWLQRSSLLFQKSYKKDTDVQLLSTYILHLASSKQFFIQKAIGWILREYAKTNPAWVRDFVNKHTLAALSQREAMKHLSDH